MIPAAQRTFLEARQSHGDQRVNIVSLTEDGRRLVGIARKEAWPLIEAAVADPCNGPLLEQLTAIEDGLADAPLERRMEKSRRAAR